MMRSMYSAVSGLRTHQSKMDVIGNNIANVNTVAFKSSSVTFSEIMYQNIAGASAANAATGRGGINPRQIGLGVTSGATTVNITSAGATETTGNPFDIKLSDKNSTNFFIVNTGAENVFTRAGSFYIDGAGNLCMSSTGYTLMGWQVDPDTGNIKKDTVSALRVMQEKFLTANPEATTNAVCAGVIDQNDKDVTSDNGYNMNLNFYDALGYSYTAKFAVKAVNPDTGEYSVELSDILDSSNKSVLTDYLENGGNLNQVFGQNTTATKTYKPNENSNIKFSKNGIQGSSVNAGDYYITVNSYQIDGTTVPVYVPLTSAEFDTANDQYTIPEYTYYASKEDAVAGTLTTVPESYGTMTELFGITAAQLQALDSGTATSAGETAAWSPDGGIAVTKPAVNYELKFSPNDGTFQFVGASGTKEVKLNLKNTLGGNFSDITIDFSQCQNSNQGGVSSMGMDSGATDGTTGAGKKLGAMTGIFIDGTGKIFGTYDNGSNVLLGQIAVAQFANASGLEKVGENCYKTTLNSGDFDGVGVDISADGSSMATGALEMSNVDLSSEFTSMITTQRGFQANSRVITTSDSLLEELINLKR